ncbi:MAG TPA: hypothetical protein VGC76_05580 [Pyrinomonadaceae bacterium]|jgi:hypothetical protein
MKKYIFLISIFLFAVTNICAQKTFIFKKVSDNFDVKIKIGSCDEDGCNDKATAFLMKKNQSKAFQTIEMKEMFLRLTEEQTSKIDAAEFSGDGVGGVYFEDFNFDGADDLALSNGNYGPYGGISYDIFLFSKTTGKFVFNEKLSGLASESMMLDTDKKKKTIEAYTKSGCCWHQTTRYKFTGNRLTKIYVFTEDASRGDDKVRLITETLIGRKWKKTTKVMRIKDYYKDDQ